VYEQDRTLEREHSIYGFDKQVNLVERTWNDDLRAMSYGLGIAIAVLGVVGTTSMEIKRLRQSRLELTALCLLAAVYLWSRMGSSAPSPISDSTSVRSADQEWHALPVASAEKGALSIARRRTR